MEGELEGAAVPVRICTQVPWQPWVPQQSPCQCEGGVSPEAQSLGAGIAWREQQGMGLGTDRARLHSAY